MIGLKKKPEETTDDFMQRSASIIKATMGKYQVEAADSMYDRRLYQWAGNLAKLKQTDPERLAYCFSIKFPENYTDV